MIKILTAKVAEEAEKNGESPDKENRDAKNAQLLVVSC